MLQFRFGRLAAGALMAALALAGAAHGVETGPLDQLRQRALELVNRERADRGLEALRLQDGLNEAAQNHAEDMLRRNYYSHTSPEGESVQDRFLDAGGSRWKLTAENIARCQGCPSPPTEDRVEELHQGWMDSPPHRENILRQGLASFGFGIAVGDDRTLYAVQTFAGPGTSRDRQPEEASALDRQEQNALLEKRLNRARTREDLPPVETHPALVEAAAQLLPQADPGSFTAGESSNPMDALPADARMQWSSLAVVMATCGGCGTRPTAGDVRSFLQQWLDNPQYRDRLLDRSFTHAGFIIRANGDGLKSALLVLGRQRQRP
ncbi:CAP domain-containing protein [Microvirga splendida]|uniref:CAP domain-containing protein n=1 Tax=Microvirga splendida TaxID=2795727 RepID=A0ABS0XVS4_9HYPH|nr:CAP domain-containing protein [Microvirga splendida]MBJ6124118.1 CAP domain-containing protein [Microvirga splendida]